MRIFTNATADLTKMRTMLTARVATANNSYRFLKWLISLLEWNIICLQDCAGRINVAVETVSAGCIQQLEMLGCAGGDGN